MSKYQTEQKKRLLSFLSAHKNEQFSAEELSDILNRGGDGIVGKAPGKSTVYRLVAEMSEEGTLRRFPKREGRGWLYQYHRMPDCSGHLHLKCEKCGMLFHLECGMSSELLAHVEKEHGFKVDNSATILYGMCAGCRKLLQNRYAPYACALREKEESELKGILQRHEKNG